MVRRASILVRLLSGVLCSALLGAVACGEGGGRPGAGEPVPFRPVAGGATPFGDVPWPSDLYLKADGTVGEIPGLERVAGFPRNMARTLARLDGFGRSTGALFFVDSEVDGATLPQTWDEATAGHVSAFIADIDARSPTFGRRYPVYARFLPTLGCVSVIPVPGIVLPPGVRHAAVLTSRVRTVAGARLVADPELERIAELRGRSTVVERLYGEAIDALLASGAAGRPGEIAALAVFTTSRRVFELPGLVRRLRGQPEPDLILDPLQAAPCSVAVFGVDTRPSLGDWLGTPAVDEGGLEWPGFDNPTGIAHDQIAVIASGAFVAPSFLDPRTRHFERDPLSGEFVLADPDAKIPVTLVIPRRPASPAGYPVVIHSHGLSNHRGSMMAVANELARAGFAMIGIDDVRHGARSGARDDANNFPGSYRGPDGIPDTTAFPVEFFGSFADFTAMNDNFRQTVIDHVSLVRLIRSPCLDLTPLAAAAGGVVPRLDRARIYWSGGSLGGIMGAMTIAVEPAIRAAALQVPGAGFIQLITTGSAEMAPLVTGLASATLGVQGKEALDEFHPVALLLQAATEAGDPIIYAPHVQRDRLLAASSPPDVLVTYAVGDEVLPNIATVALVRALGLPLASPYLFELPGLDIARTPAMGNLDSGRTGAAVQYLPANHGLGYSRFDTRNFYPAVEGEGARRARLPAGFTFEQPLREHLAQVVAFFESAAANGLARIEVTAPPRADYDADGVLDEEELRRGTDPYDPSN